jgi:unconventional prefoldin RPB5 interactor 1
VKASNKDVASNLSENQPPKKSKKSVSFAKELDIAQETDLLPQIIPHKSKVSEKVSASPISGSVIERNPSASYKDSVSSPSTSQAKKPSRFRAAQDATPQPTTSAPPEKDFPSAPATKPDLVPEIMSAAVKERPGPPSTKKAPPPDPYDFDEALHKQEITSEYYKSRNKMIQRQGGFVRDGEDDNYGEFAAPLSTVDEETGKVKKISRFKAARLR